MIILNNYITLGQVNNNMSFLGDKILLDNILVSKRSTDRLKTQLHRLYEQGATNLCLVRYVYHWIRGADAWGSLKVMNRILIITIILQHAFYFRLPLQRS